MTSRNDAGRQPLALVRMLRMGLDQEMRRQLRDDGVTPAMGLVLQRLAEVGACSHSELAEAVGVTAPTMTAAVAGLVRRELVVVDADREDRRRSVIRLTPVGRDAAEAAEAAEAQVGSAALEVVVDADREVLISVLEAMLGNLQPGGVGDDGIRPSEPGSAEV